MKLPEICINRPVFATVLSLILIAVGIVGFHYLNTRFMPKFQQKSIMVTTYYPGASAKLVETNITTPLEQHLTGIEGIDRIKSQSAQGMSTITIKLLPGYNVYQTSNQVRNKISLASSELPSTIKPPTVQVGWGTMDLLDIGFTAQHESVDALRDYLQRYVITRIQQVPGVADVEIDGANKYAMRIWVDPEKLAALQLSVSDISTAVTNSNLELPAGEIKGDAINYPITAKTKLNSATAFGNIAIKQQNGHIVRLKDVAKVELGEDPESQLFVHINGKRGVVLTVYNTTDSNPITTANHIQTLLSDIRAQLPAGMKGFITFNQATYMKASVHEVYLAIAMAIFCVALIIFLFLGNMRTVLIPTATIPVCLITTFGLMYFFGFTINVITLLAVVLSIGLVVDDAIVMVENIYRHIEAGEKPLKAALKGSKEITFAVIAMTLTLAAVYAPIGLIQGRAAKLFASFAFTLSGAVIISGFVALTLSPMMCSKLLRSKQHTENRYSRFIERFFTRLAEHYKTALHFLLSHHLSVVGITLLIATGGYFLFTSMPKAFVPREDMGFVISVFHTPSGTNAKSAQTRINTLTQVLHHYPAVKTTTAFSSESTAHYTMIFTTLKPYAHRHLSAQQLSERINKETANIPGLNAHTFAPSFGGSSQHQLEFMIMSSGSTKSVYKTAQALLKQLKSYPGLTGLDTDMTFNSQQYVLTVKRPLADALQVSVSSIDSTVAAMLGGSPISTFDLGNQTYQVYLQAQQHLLGNINAINQFYVKSATAQMVPLSNLVVIKPVLTQPTLNHYNELRSAIITAQLAPGTKLGTAVHYLQNHLSTLLPNNTKYEFTGVAKRLLDSNSNLALIFSLAIVFIYLVLSAQFESFIDPFIILLAVPLSMVGALSFLKLVNGSINLYTTVGLVTLIGLIAKHGILITQFANELQKQGSNARDALIEAASIRLRPILMTTGAMVFGALPLALAAGASALSREQIDMVIIGGLLFGTFFSLVLVPITYSYANKLKTWLDDRKP